MSFVVRPLEREQGLGEKLHAMRSRLAISLEMAEAATKIRASYLRAIEEGAWHKLPPSVYVRNYLKKYVQYLGGDPVYFLSRFESECRSCDFLAHARLPRQKVRRGRFLVSSRVLATAGLCLLFLSLMGYLGWQIYGIVEPPALTVFTPADGTSTTEPKLDVSGVVDGEASVFVNGSSVLPTPNGSFSTTVTLERGYNLITIESKRRHSRPFVIHRRVLFGRPQTWYTVGAR
ncbi:helix-turn-helix domain-containing protein [Candidatus Uhrbacteria bacterium]|nr:helix-turn-helix domain-containing protein [Candidatus Uhrbacteria bacterium]